MVVKLLQPDPEIEAFWKAKYASDLQAQFDKRLEEEAMVINATVMNPTMNDWAAALELCPGL